MKETHALHESGVIYRADWDVEFPATRFPGRWISPIFCKREFSRINLAITSVKIERLQDISEADALAEGVVAKPSAGPASTVPGGTCGPAKFEYFSQWEKINHRGSWDANPWVWVLGIERIGS